MTFEQRIEFASGGRSFAASLFEPPGMLGLRPGVLVLHGGAGLGAHEQERARRLSELGWIALAPDLFDEAFTSREHGIEVISRLVASPEVLRARLGDAVASLRSRPNVDAARLAAIGFCFGGMAALELARSGAAIRAVASFHGGLTTKAPARQGEVKAAILVCTGAADPFVTREHRSAFEDEMTQAQADWQVHVHAKAMHGFTERHLAESKAQRPGCEYHEAADRRSWAAMRSLFEELFSAESRHSRGPLRSEEEFGDH